MIAITNNSTIFSVDTLYPRKCDFTTNIQYYQYEIVDIIYNLIFLNKTQLSYKFTEFHYALFSGHGWRVICRCACGFSKFNCQRNDGWSADICWNQQEGDTGVP
jgi:hypothetical protein